MAHILRTDPGEPYPNAVTCVPVGTTSKPLPTAMSEVGLLYCPPPPGTPGSVTGPWLAEHLGLPAAR